MVSGLFRRSTTISGLKNEELRQERIRLEMEQDRSFRKIEDAEKTKQALFKEMLGYTDKARMEAVANRIGTFDTQARLEQSAIRAVSRQLKLIYTAETIKRFQERNFQSTVVKRLLGARIGDLDKTLVGLISEGQNIDETTKELLGAIGFAVPESDREVQDLVKLAVAMRDQALQDPDAAADQLRQQWNRQKGLEKSEPA